MERDTQPSAEARTQPSTRMSPRDRNRAAVLPVLLREVTDKAPVPRTLAADANEEKTDPRAEGACLFDLTPQEWRFIRNAPVVGFLMVASADGMVFPRERRALVDALEQGKRSASELFRAVCRELYRQRHELMALFVSDTFEHQQLAEAHRLIAERLGQDEAERFKACLLMLGRNVARASGGFGASWGWLRGVEREALAKLAAGFGSLDA